MALLATTTTSNRKPLVLPILLQSFGSTRRSHGLRINMHSSISKRFASILSLFVRQAIKSGKKNSITSIQADLLVHLFVFSILSGPWPTVILADPLGGTVHQAHVLSISVPIPYFLGTLDLLSLYTRFSLERNAIEFHAQVAPSIALLFARKCERASEQANKQASARARARV